MFCINCGKEITDNSVFCPECGVAQKKINIKRVPYNTMCILGIVVSCISLLLNPYGLVGIAGTVLSVLGLIECKKKNENGKALAICGILLGISSILYVLYVYAEYYEYYTI